MIFVAWTNNIPDRSVPIDALVDLTQLAYLGTQLEPAVPSGRRPNCVAEPLVRRNARFPRVSRQQGQRRSSGSDASAGSEFDWQDDRAGSMVGRCALVRSLSLSSRYAT